MLMGRVGGYTLIEVMIFLAISGVLFVSAVVLIQGQQGRTQFSQSIRDIDSKLQQYVTEVSASYFPSTEKYSCSVDSVTGRPKLKLVANKALGSNEDCIFLGKALQFTHYASGNTDDTITSYSVLGRRTEVVNVSGGTTQTILVPSFSDANPTPTSSLVDTYTLPFGTKVASAKDNSGGTSAMAGFYVDLSQTTSDASANKSASLVSYQYPNNVDLSTPADVSNASLYGCLTLNKSQCSGLIGSPTPLPNPFSKWVLCFKSGANNQTATITVKGGPIGIQTKIDYVSCS